MFFTSTASADKLALIDALTSCNPDFFKHVYEHKDELKDHTNVKIFNQNQAYIPV